MIRENMSALQALERLREGNRRFASNVRSIDSMICRRDDLAQGQRPVAIVLACSDSRSPAEMVFDQGLGDLFVIRVAGNVVAPSQIGSVEFAVEQFGTRLVVLMGHSHCGAIAATLDAIENPGGAASRNLAAIVDRIRPAVLPLTKTEVARDRVRLAALAVRANVRAAANQLRNASPILERRILEDGLLIVGAEHHLETGVVDFFDGAPEGF